MDTASDIFRVGISGSYGRLNLGDEAILQAILSPLRHALPVMITVFSRDEDDTRQRHPVEHVVPIRKLTRDEARAEVERLDLLILGGGGILYDGEGEAYLREVMLAHEIGVPVIVYAIGAGPLMGSATQQLVRETLNRAALVTVRDRQACKPSRYRKQHAFRQGFRDDLPARRADRQPHGRLRPARDRAGQ